MIRYQVLVLAAAVGLAVSAAQAQFQPAVIYGGDQPEKCHALVEGVDPGYCMAGWSRSFNPVGAADALVIKVDPLGAPMWAAISVGESDDEAHSMVRTHDQSYAITGWTRSYGPGIPNKNIFVTKLGAEGIRIWAWVFGGDADDEAYSICETMDGGYVVAGFTHSFGPPPYPNILLLKLAPNGTPVWLRVYWIPETGFQDEAYAVVQTPDSGYALAGRLKATSATTFDPFVLKTDQIGQPLWIQISPGPEDDDEAYALAVDLYGNILVSGWTRSFGTNPLTTADLFVAQFGPIGIPNWSWTYGWPAGDEMVLEDRSLVATMDGGSAVCGPTTSVGPGTPAYQNFLILKLDQNGMFIWGRSHPSPYEPGLLDDVPLPMIQESNRGYAIAGWSDSYTHLGGPPDFHFLTLDSMGNRRVCVEPQEPSADSLPWTPWEVCDTTIRPRYDSMPFGSVEVLYHYICEDTTSIREGGLRPGLQGNAASLLVAGRKVVMNLGFDADVEVEAFSADGRRIAVVTQGRLYAGRHEWVLPEGPAGVCLVRAQVAGRTYAAKTVRF